MRRLLVLLASVACFLGVLAAPSSAGSAFTLSSPDFADGGSIPISSTCWGLGLGHPPALRWTGVPSGTTELALIVTDPEGVTGTVDHWVVYGIPTTDSGSANGQTPQGSTQGLDSFLLPAWLPPCAPSTTAHHYVFTLYALDTHVKATGLLPLTAQQLQATVAGHVLGQATLAGLSALLN